MLLVFSKFWQSLAGCWRVRWVRRGTVLGLTLIGLVSGIIEIYNFVSPPPPMDPALTDEIFGGDKQRQDAIRKLREEEERAKTERDRQRFAEARERAEAGDSSDAEAIYREILLANRHGNAEAKARAAEAAVSLGALTWAHNTEAAAAAYREATQLAPNNGSAWNNWGFLEWSLGNIDTAQAAIGEALQLAQLQGDRVQVMRATGNLGLLSLTSSDFGKAEELFLKAWNLASDLNDEASRGWYDVRLGVTYIEADLHDLAEDPLREALVIAERHGNRDLEATAQLNLVTVYLDRNDLVLARDTAQQALDLAVQLGDQGGIATASSHLGSIHERQGELEAAETMFLKALAIDEELGSKSNVAGTQTKLGGLYRTMQRPEEGKWRLQVAVRLRRELGNRTGLMASLNDLGLVSRDLELWPESEAAFAEAYQLAEALGNRRAMAMTASNIAKLFELQNDRERQCLALDDAARLFSEVQDKAHFDAVRAVLAEFECQPIANDAKLPQP